MAKYSKSYSQSIAKKYEEIFPLDAPKRTVKYRPEYCDVVVSLARLEGAPFSACLAEIGVSAKTAERWLSQHPEFKDAKERGEAEATRFWHKVGVLGCLGKIYGFRADVWKLYMKNIAKFSDQVNVSARVENVIVTTQIGADGTIEKNELTDEQAMGILEDIDNADIENLDQLESKTKGEDLI